MEINKKCIVHYVIEILLFIICIGIGFLEDAFIPFAFFWTTIYNFCYIILLRQLTGEKLLKSICNIILIWAIGLAGIYNIYNVCIFFAGYTYYGFFGDMPGTTYYGLDAWKNNLFTILFFPVALINILYIVIYFVIKKKRRKI